MPNLRGLGVLNTMRFVRQRYGDSAHISVLHSLSAAQRAALEEPIGESAWRPLEAVLAYMDTAHALLAPDDPTFFLELGRFSGRITRNTPFQSMLRSPGIALRLLAVLWRAFFDQGRARVVCRTEGSALVRLYDFPKTTRGLCGSLGASWEATLEHRPELDFRVSELSCRVNGTEYCEWKATWAI
jgi:hypothetical protein